MGNPMENPLPNWRTKEPLGILLNREAWRQRVKNYIAIGDRGKEPVFVGRESHLEAVRELAHNCQLADASGHIMVILGAPGAGKTRFLNEVKDQEKRLGILPVMVSDGKFHKPGQVLIAIAKALHSRLDKDIAETSKGTSSGVRASAGVGGASKLWARQTTSLVERASREEEFPFSEAHELLRLAGERRPIAILVDEAQRIAPTPGAKGALGNALNRVLTSIHDGNDLPAFAVFAGLSETYEHLVSLGLSRTSKIAKASAKAPMANLSDTEAEEYLWRTLDYLGAWGDRREAQRFIDDTLKGSDNWPHHLRNAMDALSAVMLEVDSPDIGANMKYFKDIQALEKTAREEYYAERLIAAGKKTAFQKEIARAVIESLHKEGGFADEATLFKSASRALESCKTAQPRLAKRGGGGDEQVFKALEHGGVIQPSPENPDHWMCPIPSLSSWIRKNCPGPPSIENPPTKKQKSFSPAFSTDKKSHEYQ